MREGTAVLAAHDLLIRFRIEGWEESQMYVELDL